LHDKEGLAVRHLAHIDHTDDARVINSDKCLNFFLEFLREPRIAECSNLHFSQSFNNDRTREQVCIMCEVDNAEPTSRQFLINHVTALKLNPYKVHRSSTEHGRGTSFAQFV